MEREPVEENQNIEPPAKQPRLMESTDDIKQSQVEQEVAKVEPTIETVNEVTVITVEETTSPVDDTEYCCAICMESEPAVRMLERHNCPQCVPHAWKICERCDAQLLSRTCPICQHAYKELTMYVVEDVPQMPVDFASILDAKERYVMTMTIRSVFEVFTSTNSAVWCPDNSRMYFSLPQDMSVAVSEMKFILLSIAMSPDRLENNRTFKFDSSVWDEIEREMENGDTEGDFKNMVDATAKEAARWHMQALKRHGAKALTPLRPDEWSDIGKSFGLSFDSAASM